MSVSRSLKENISDVPEKINDSTIGFIKTEKWEVSKISLLEQRVIIETDIATKQAQIDEIDSLLAIFK